MTEIWSTAADFLDDYQHIGIPTTISNQNATTLFYLLYARYGNNPIANYDEEQFKYKIFSVVFQYGPTWEKKLALQATLRDLQLSDLIDDGAISELFSHQGENGVTESSFGMSERASEQEVAGSENGSVKSSEDSTNSMAQAVERTGSSTVARTGSAETEHTGTSEVERLGSQEINRTGTSVVSNTGTSTVASTGTSELAHTGTVGVEHDNDIENSGDDTTINNHAFNPGTAPAVNAYDPLAYINEQNAQKVTKGTKSEQDESSVTTYSNADTTTNNLQNQTTNNLQNSTVNDLTDATVSSSADTTTQNLKDKVTNDLTDTTTNNLTDSTESTGAASKEGTTVSEKGTSSHTEGSESVSNTGSKTVAGNDSSNDSRTRTMTVGKLEAYDRLLKLLDSDVTGEFISKFKLCFKQFVFPERTWIYVSEDGQEED